MNPTKVTPEITRITLKIKNRGEISFECRLDDPILRDLCYGYASRNQPRKRLMYLDLSGSEFGKVIFPRSSFVSLTSTVNLPEDFFEKATVSSCKKSVDDYLHLNIDRKWIEWGLDAVEKGMHVAKIFQKMHDGGMPRKDVEILLGYKPNEDPKLVKVPAAESIEPYGKSKLNPENRFLSDYIELYIVPDFLSSNECLNFENLLNETPEQPGVLKDTVADSSRTGDSHIYAQGKYADPTVATYQARICKLLQTSLLNAEPLRCQIYSKNKQYRAHVDYLYKPDIETYESAEGSTQTGQREWTVLVYLRDGEEGSGTWFSKIKEEFYPSQGTAMIWRNIYPSGNVNPYTIHAALPVGHKRKAVLTQWVRNNRV